MIELGIRKIDIVHCLIKHGVPAHETLLIIEDLIINKEVIRDEKNGLHLTDKLPPMPEDTAKMVKDCIGKLRGEKRLK